MNMFAYFMIKLFFAAQCLAGFFLIIFGGAMLSDPNLTVVMIGGMLCCVGVATLIMFSVLLIEKEI